MLQRLTHLLAYPISSWICRVGIGIASSGALAVGTLPAAAVETVTVELGPTKTNIHVSDLETFAESGHVPKRLERYRPLMTRTVRETLRNHLSVEPSIRDRFLEDLMTAENGRPFVNLLAEVAPNVSPAVIQTAMQEAEAAPSGVTALSLLRALPGENLSLNGVALMRVLSQLGLSRLEQAALGNVLDQELDAHSTVLFSKEFDPSQPGNRGFQRWSVSFRDRDRDRIIPVDLYWNKRYPGPVVVLSHGFGANRHFLDYMAEHLASHGLTVVTLEHPGSNVDALVKEDGALLPAHEFIERPRDVSFILDRLEKLNYHSFLFRGRFDMEKVTLIGHSLGGYTGLVLTGGKVDPISLAEFCADLEIGASSPADWFQCSAADAKLPPESLADPRITQLVLMNPLAGQIFGDAGLRPVKVSTLVVTSTSDGIASISDQQLRPFNQLSGPRSLVAIIGGTHLSVGDPDNINPALTRVPFMPEHPEEETLRLRQYLNGAVLSFIMQQTRRAKQYQPFLSPEYAQSFSTPALPIRYSDRLPDSVNRWLATRDKLNHQLTPTLKSLASLLHLEVIGAQYRLARLQRRALSPLSIRPRRGIIQAERSLSTYRAAIDQPETVQPQSGPPESPRE